MMTVLVTGASGTVGSAVVRRLHAGGVAVRALVRDAPRAAATFGEDVDLAVGDFADPAALDVALKGIDRVFLACANHPRQVDYEANVIDASARAGVGRVVKLSANGAQTGSPLDFWHWHGRIEQRLDLSGLPAVVLRPNFYMTNVLASAAAVQRSGQLVLPAAGARVAMIDPRDVAAAAVAALGGAGEDGARYALTGPEAISFASVAESLAAVSGSDVEFVDVPDDAARAAMVDSGMPAFIADNLITLFGLLRQGAQEATTDDVRTLAGHRPRSFAEWALDHAATFTRS